MTIDLYSVKDIKNVREKLFKEQKFLDKLTGLTVDHKTICLDHSHDENQYVRAVLHRQTNAALGKLENVWLRYLSYWYPYSLPTFLRQAADYIDNFSKQPDKRYRHPSWMKKVKTLFNKLQSKNQDKVLLILAGIKGKNVKERKTLFNKIVSDRNKGFLKIKDTINKVKASGK